VSRELLQESRDVKAIREGNTRRVLSMLEDLAKHDQNPPAQEGVTDVPSDEELAKRRAEQDKLGWKPAKPRTRKVSAALRAYALLATSADKGAVRDLSKLPN